MRNIFNSSLIFLVIIFSGCTAVSIDPSLPSDIEKTYVFKGLTNDYERAMDAYRQKDYNRSFALLQPLAENNDTRAQRELGFMYRYGFGVSKNENIAKMWEKKAFDLNQNQVKKIDILNSLKINASGVDATSLCEMGYAYLRGVGVERNRSRAEQWFQLAANAGSADAQFEIANSYFIGTTGYPHISHWGIQNYTKAFYWFQKAAVQGQPEAQYYLGRMYAGMSGKSYDEIPIDKQKAFFWWMKSAEQHHSPSYDDIAVAFLKGDGVEQDFNQSAYWYEQSEKMGYYWSKGQAELIRKELISRENLAGKGDVHAQYELGMLFRYSRIPDSRYWDIPRNDIKAKYWFKKAADQGDENSLKEYNKL
jgi:TPR repeat protein